MSSLPPTQSSPPPTEPAAAPEPAAVPESATAPESATVSEPTAGPPTPPEAAPTSRAQFWLVVAGVIVAAILWGYRGDPSKAPPPVLQAGRVLDAPITLVTADRNDLACAMPKDIQGYGCAWTDSATRNPSQPAADHLVAPYLTTTGQTYLVAGLFEQPSVAKRYERERPEGRKREELRRFVAQCKLRLIAESPEVRLQFAPSSPWSDPTRAWIAVPEDCSIQ